jgi:hypothetical protein
MKNPIVQNLKDLWTLREQLPEGELHCFRGQADASWDLVPGMFRDLGRLVPEFSQVEDAAWVGQLERDIYREFDRTGARYLPDEFTNDPWHRLFLAQHHGVPTRLLDWTSNLLAAAYFAVSDPSDADAALWVLNVARVPVPDCLGRLARGHGWRLDALTEVTETRGLSFFAPRSRAVRVDPSSARLEEALPSDVARHPDWGGFLIVLEPPTLDERMKNQASLFSVYVAVESNDIVWNHREYFEHVEREYKRELLWKFVVPKAAKHAFRIELEHSGIDPHLLYPDLPGLVMRLKQERTTLYELAVAGRHRAT